MNRRSVTGLDRRGLRLWLGLFFLLLALPAALLVQQAYSQLKWEVFHQYQTLAAELTARIDGRLNEWIDAEENRPEVDYGFLLATGEGGDIPQRSPLSGYPVAGGLPGLIGHFQIDADGLFTTPLLPGPDADPARYGLSDSELAERRRVRQRLLDILGRNQLVAAASSEPEPEPATVRRERSDRDDAMADAEESAELSGISASPPAQQAFDQLADVARSRAPEPGRLGRVEDLQLESRYALPAEKSSQRQFAPGPPTEDETPVAEPLAAPAAPPPAAAPAAPVRVRTFERVRDPFEFSLLDSGHFVLFRKVWRDGQRLIQGLLIEQQPFLQSVIGNAFRGSGVAPVSDLVVAYRGEVFALFGGAAARDYLTSAAELSGTLLYRSRLSAPLGELELIFSITRLPTGPGGWLLLWTVALLVLVLCGGCYALYRLGLRQIELTRQQQDFVAAVSHELKTPLTSIRMYAEMLREGWASEAKKRSYYDYICDESERLSRLIANVLQLARMNRNELRVELRPQPVGELLDEACARVATPVERAGFRLVRRIDADTGNRVVLADRDGFVQIIINLVDNALKFAARAERREVELGARRQGDRMVLFTVRDYGPGIPRGQVKHIFRLFYRGGSELTRETAGTGIGLALVEQLARAMQGQVEVINRDPGAEFRLMLAAHPSGSTGTS